MPSLVFTQEIVRLGAFRQRSLKVVDVGARYGADAVWEIYGDQIEVIGFEPDQSACEALGLSAGNTSWLGRRRREIYYPVALYRHQGVGKLHVTRKAECSSLFCPNRELLDRFHKASRMDIVARLDVKMADLDSFATDLDIGHVDFMKLDAQGAELAVLEGATSLLSNSVLGLSVEVAFLPIYVNQPLFSAVDTFLRDHGFVLFDLEISRWRRKTLGREFTGRSGQVAWAQALYFRDLPAELRHDSVTSRYDSVDVLKLASLAEVFHLPDFALECLNAANDSGVLSNHEHRRYAELFRETGVCRDHEERRRSVDVLAFMKAVGRRCVPRRVRHKLKMALMRLLLEG